MFCRRINILEMKKLKGFSSQQSAVNNQQSAISTQQSAHRTIGIESQSLDVENSGPYPKT